MAVWPTQATPYNPYNRTPSISIPPALRGDYIEDPEDVKREERMLRLRKFKKKCRDLDSAVVDRFMKSVWQPLKRADQAYQQVVISQGTAMRALRYSSFVISVIKSVMNNLKRAVEDTPSYEQFHIAREAIYRHLGDHISSTIPGVLTTARSSLTGHSPFIDVAESFFLDISGCRGAAINPESWAGSSHGVADLTNTSYNLEEVDKDAHKRFKELKAMCKSLNGIETLVRKKLRVKKLSRGVAKVVSKGEDIPESVNALEQLSHLEKTARQFEAAAVTLLRNLIHALNSIDSKECDTLSTEKKINSQMVDFIKETIYSNIGLALYQKSPALRQEFRNLCAGNLGEVGTYIKSHESQTQTAHPALLQRFSRTGRWSRSLRDSDPFAEVKDDEEFSDNVFSTRSASRSVGFR